MQGLTVHVHLAHLTLGGFAALKVSNNVNYFFQKYIPIFPHSFHFQLFNVLLFVFQIVKTAVRELWSLEYEIEEIQTEFAKGIGSIDIANLTDDFVEDVMLQSKPLQGILMAIRLRQKVCIVLLTTIYALSLSNWNDCAP